MKATILLVYDHAGIRDSLGHTLRLEDCGVTVTSNGPEALDSLRGSSLDLMLLNPLTCLN
jgi:CheY-like chemotaxis protein